MDDHKQKHLSPEDLSQRWHVSTQTLANWRSVKQHKGPPYLKLGQSVVYDIADIEAYEKANKITPEEYPEPPAPAVPRMDEDFPGKYEEII